jgi:hypothetical protein
MSKLRCTAADIDIDKANGRALGVNNPLARGAPPKPWCVHCFALRRRFPAPPARPIPTFFLSSP